MGSSNRREETGEEMVLVCEDSVPFREVEVGGEVTVLLLALLIVVVITEDEADEGSRSYAVFANRVADWG